MLEPIKNSNELCGTEPKFYLDVPDGPKALGIVISQISDVFIKLKQAKLRTEEVSISASKGNILQGSFQSLEI